VEIRWAKSATKHRISRQRSGHVVKTTDVIIRQPAPEDSPLEDDRIVFLGPDPNGVSLEVIAVELGHSLLIIHAMKMRPEYQPFLEEKPHVRTRHKARRSRRAEQSKPRHTRRKRDRQEPQAIRVARYTRFEVGSAHH
jgi:hypothetical protein